MYTFDGRVYFTLTDTINDKETITTKINSTMEKIHVSFVKDLRNREFSLLINTIAETLAKSKSENKSLKKATKNLQSHNKKLLKLKDTKPRHHLTRIIKEKVQKRTDCLVCLRMRIESSLLSPIAQERIAAERLMYWIDPYRKVLFKPSIQVQTQAVEFLNLDRSESTIIQEHASLLNIDYLLDVAIDETEDIKSYVTERGKDKADKAINGKNVRAAAYYDLRVLLEAMKTIYNLSSNTQEAEEMVRLSALINEILKSFRRELRSRNTKRSNKKEIDMGVEKLIGNEADNSVDVMIFNNDGAALDEPEVSPTFSAQNFKVANSKLKLDIINQLKNDSLKRSGGALDFSLIKRDKKKDSENKLPFFGIS